MQVGIRTMRVVRTEASETEWEALRRLVAEGLTVVETMTPAMVQVAEALGLQVRDDTPDPEPRPKPPRKTAKRPTAPTPPPKEG